MLTLSDWGSDPPVLLAPTSICEEVGTQILGRPAALSLAADGYLLAAVGLETMTFPLGRNSFAILERHNQAMKQYANHCKSIYNHHNMTNGRNSCHFLQLNTQRNPLFSLMA
jgi:hypothetical protein